MNNDEKMSSSNTTPFNNRSNSRVLNNEKLEKYTTMKQIRPRNNNINNVKLNDNFEPLTKNDESNNNQQFNSQRIPDKKDNKATSRRSPFGPKNRLNNTASDLRDKLDTNPNMKDEAVKKGAEALKKSANPYAKAAGYATSFLQKRKDKKKKEEDKEENKDDDKNEENNNQNNDEESTSIVENKTRTKIIIRVIMIILPFVLGLLLLLSLIMPVLNAYSWFQSLFHHKSDDPDSYYVYDKNQQELKEQEIAFNNTIVGSKDGSIKGIIQEYKEKYGVTIDKSILVATITYRYSVEDTDKIYTDDGNNDIDDEELNNKLNELDQNEDDESSEEDTNDNKIDYKNAEKKIKTVASLMVIKEGNSYTTDSEVGGKVYNALIESNFLKNYYKKILKDNSYESRKKLVDEIFDYAEGARLMDDEYNQTPVSGGVIGDTSIVHLQTCKLKYSYKDKNGIKVYDNPAWNTGTEYPDYLNMKEYLKGVVKSEIGVGSDYKEAMKAQAIAALTFLINDSRSGFDLKDGEMYFPSGTCRQAACSPTYGCTSYPEPTAGNPNITTHVVGLNRKSGGRNHNPISEADNEILEEVLNDIFGKIMVKKGVTTATYSGSSDTSTAQYLDKCSAGKCFSQQDAKKDAKNGMNYVQILAKYYSNIDYDIIDITEGLYTSVGFSNADFNGNIVYYSQHSYKNVQFCGRSNATISSSGCGVTSAAIVASSLTGNKKYDPKYMMEWAYKEKECGAGISGTNDGFFAKFASGLGLKYQSVGRENTNVVVEALKTGKALVIAHMGKGHFTNHGHYIVLSGLNDKGEVMVQDPNDSNKNHYWDINLIANEIQTYGNFHIISL